LIAAAQFHTPSPNFKISSAT